jgi:hypothetical protein
MFIINGLQGAIVPNRMELLCQIGWSIVPNPMVRAHPPRRKLLKNMHFHCAKSDGRFCRFSLPIVPNRMGEGKLWKTKTLFPFCQVSKLTHRGFFEPLQPVPRAMPARVVFS